MNSPNGHASPPSEGAGAFRPLKESAQVNAGFSPGPLRLTSPRTVILSKARPPTLPQPQKCHPKRSTPELSGAKDLLLIVSPSHPDVSTTAFASRTQPRSTIRLR